MQMLARALAGAGPRLEGLPSMAMSQSSWPLELFDDEAALEALAAQVLDIEGIGPRPDDQEKDVDHARVVELDGMESEGLDLLVLDHDLVD
jgi:hypothetical protein